VRGPVLPSLLQLIANPPIRQQTGSPTSSLSPTTVVRLKEAWTRECQEWSDRSLAGKQFVYLWVDGVHFNVRLEDGRQCILVVMGTPKDGKKELVPIHDGYRESTESWNDILLDLKKRGLQIRAVITNPPAALVVS
jgi:putative transposase